MAEDEITRRSFLGRVAGLISLLIVGFVGCKKTTEEKPKAEKEAAPAEMTDEEKAEYVFAHCICTKCPSYVECSEKAGFCLAGKSTCIKEKKGCICPDCPVTKKMGLKWGYYCTEGSAEAIMEAEKAKIKEG